MNPRHELAQAKIALRQAKDAHEVSRAIAEQRAIEQLNGSLGKNEAERARNLTVALAYDLDYNEAFNALRAAEAQVDQAQAEVDIANDELRRAELAARERLAEALMNKRADEATFDYTAALNAPYDR